MTFWERRGAAIYTEETAPGAAKLIAELHPTSTDLVQAIVDAHNATCSPRGACLGVDAYLAVIEYKGGVNFYARSTKAELEAEIASYCREFADQQAVELTDAMTDLEVINTYFGQVENESVTFEGGPATL